MKKIIFLLQQKRAFFTLILWKGYFVKAGDKFSMELNELVYKAKKGSKTAFESLYALVYKDMYYFALSRLKNEADACDAVSDAILDAYEGIKKLKEPEKFKSWIFTILTRKITKKYSENKNRIENTKEIEAVDILSMETPDLSKIEALEILNTLSEKEREIFSLCYVCGFTSEEISQITNTNPSTVRSHILRAKNKLKKIYNS